jgi:peptidoglycan/xylan/chitin deacetylase (PgdA/CDA1 family)
VTAPAETFLPARDLTGYGRDRPRPSWPGGARVAVSLVVNFEEGSELSVADGDTTGESGKGGWDPTADQQFAYGSRAGFRRVMNALAKHRTPATFYMCGRAIERLPELAKEAVAAGHEPACHGWRWRAHASYKDSPEERADLQRCIDVSKAVTGERPFGFFCRGNESPATRGLLRELGFLYTSNAFDDDLPYWDKSGNAPLLVIPYSFDSNDMRIAKPGGFVRATEFSGYVADCLDALIAEGEAGSPKMLSIGLHLRMVGRPGHIAGLQQILAHLDKLGDKVWVTRRIDIAKFWAEHFPPKT